MKTQFMNEDPHEGAGSMKAPYNRVTFDVYAPALKDRLELFQVVRDILDGEIEKDLTLEDFAHIEDEYLKEPWEKARWIAENAACLLLAEIATQWGMGYRSDDGFDDLGAAQDNVLYLTNVDLNEEDFMLWWNAGLNTNTDEDYHNGHYIAFGAVDGEIRFAMFPKRGEG